MKPSHSGSFSPACVNLTSLAAGHDSRHVSPLPRPLPSLTGGLTGSPTPETGPWSGSQSAGQEACTNRSIWPPRRGPSTSESLQSNTQWWIPSRTSHKGWNRYVLSPIAKHYVNSEWGYSLCVVALIRKHVSQPGLVSNR